MARLAAQPVTARFARIVVTAAVVLGPIVGLVAVSHDAGATVTGFERRVFGSEAESPTDEALDSSADLLATELLSWTAPRRAGPPDDGRVTPSNRTEVMLGTVFESLFALRIPLVLLAGGVLGSVAFEGLTNLGLPTRMVVPRLARRARRRLAVVRVGEGERLDVLQGPDGMHVVARLGPTDRGLQATGSRTRAQGSVWVEILVGNDRGWVPDLHLTEEVDRAGFADDPEPMALLRDFMQRLRSRSDMADLVSRHGLSVAHHGPVVHFPCEALSSIMDDPATYLWRGRNPAHPAVEGTFDLTVATSMLDAYDHPRRELRVDSPIVASTAVPVEFTNLHFIAIGADLHGPDRLTRSGWLVMFAHEEGRPRIAALVRE